MYNFLSTKIDLSNNRFTKQNRQNVNSIFDSTRMLHINLIRGIETCVREICAHKDISKYNSTLYNLYEYANFQRLENNQKQAINAYDYFMNELNKSGTYIDDSSEFNDVLDMTEIKYNLAFLYYELGDFEMSLQHFAIADEYYSKKNNTEIGHLLIGMIDKQGTPFWSFSNHLCLNCGGYDSFGRAFGY